MAVYTRVTQQDLDQLLAQYDVGTLRSHHPISAGITNTNYLVVTTQGRWILTLFEDMSAQELPFFMQVMDGLSAQKIPGAHPVKRQDGQFLSQLHNRPTALVYCLDGQSIERPNAKQCQSLGQVVAKMHLATQKLTITRTNPRNLAWISRTAQQVQAKLSQQEAQLLNEQIKRQHEWAKQWQNLPKAIIHADIFRDNVLFSGDAVSGIIDFYYACRDFLLFDLAVICNDWCFNETGEFNEPLWQAFLRGYDAYRPLTQAEKDAWPGMLKAAALRYWTSRLYDYHFPASGDLTHTHDPKPMENLLRHHCNQPHRIQL